MELLSKIIFNFTSLVPGRFELSSQNQGGGRRGEGGGRRSRKFI
jgi:hypothetical protein